MSFLTLALLYLGFTGKALNVGVSISLGLSFVTDSSVVSKLPRLLGILMSMLWL